MGGGFVIETSGGALSDAMALPGVDWRRATSNNVCEVCATLGIEAARVVLLRELVVVRTFRSGERRLPQAFRLHLCALHRRSLLCRRLGELLLSNIFFRPYEAVGLYL